MLDNCLTSCDLAVLFPSAPSVSASLHTRRLHSSRPLLSSPLLSPAAHRMLSHACSLTALGLFGSEQGFQGFLVTSGFRPEQPGHRGNLGRKPSSSPARASQLALTKVLKNLPCFMLSMSGVLILGMCWSVWVQWPPAESPGLAAGNARLCGKLRQQRQRSQRTACA